MSPEQAKGRPVDKRTDVWAFGCVLYEMLTARRAFEGETVAETLARVLERDPDMGRLPATLPPVMRAFLARCLHRDLKQRVRDVGDVRLALMGAFGGPAADAPATRTWLVPALSALAALVIGGLVVRDRAAPDIIAQPPARTALLTADVPPVNVSGFGPDVVLTPDGTRVVYSSRGQLFVRALSELAPRLLVSGSIPGNLFVSPDGRWIGFTERTQLRRISIDGGPASTICVIDGTGTRGSTWTADGTIVFATSFDETGLQRVAAEGGTPSVLTRPDRSRGEDDHLWPEMLPDGRNLLFTITAVTGGLEAAQVATFDLETGARKVLFKGGTHARYVPSGHLVYMAGGSLYAVAFDLATLEVHGDGIPVIGGVVTTNNGGGNFSTSINGALLYVAASTVAERQLLWVDRAGREEDVGTPMRPYFSPRVSPDGSRIAVRIADRDQDIWVWEVQRQVFTLGTSLENSPAWAPDGARLLFTSNTGGAGMNMWSGASDGSRSAERLFDSASTKSFTAISPDGRFGLFHEVSPTRARDLMLLPLAPVSEPRPLVQSTSEERNGILSPDGRWLAYESDESGRFEVYVRPFPNVGDGQWRVSTDGGVQPLWSPDGRSLFFLDGQQRLSDVRVDANGRAWSASQPETVFDRAYFPGGQDWLRSYDISPDGKRFVMIKDEERARPAPILVQHWTEELKRLVPVTR
jgi:serine/threonine-protein kinase